MASFVRDYTALITPDFTWNQAVGQPIQAKAVFLTYSFAEEKRPAAFGVQLGDPNYFRPLSGFERDIFRQSLDAWASVSGIMFFEVPSGFGDIDVGAYDMAGNIAGQASMPQSGYFRDGAGYGLFAPSTDYRGVYLDREHGMDKHVMMHEIGHALGLEHSHDGSAPFLAADLDNGRNTVMSYNDNLPQLGLFDIQAIQALYGTNSADGRHVASWSWNAATHTLTQRGTGASDVLHGTGTHDVIFGGGGRDLIVARGGDDTIHVSGKMFNVASGTGFDRVHLDFSRTQLRDHDLNGDIMYLLANGSASWDMVLMETERVHFTDAVLATDLAGIAGQAYRLYQAAFDRQPDEVGLGYWIRELDAGKGGMAWVANNFILSDEFARLYGAPGSVSNDKFLTLLYNNVLNRDPDGSGFDYWRAELARGFERERVLASFSESFENQANVANQISDGIWYV